VKLVSPSVTAREAGAHRTIAAKPRSTVSAAGASSGALHARRWARSWWSRRSIDASAREGSSEAAASNLESSRAKRSAVEASNSSASYVSTASIVPALRGKRLSDRSNGVSAGASMIGSTVNAVMRIGSSRGLSLYSANITLNGDVPSGNAGRSAAITRSNGTV